MDLIKINDNKLKIMLTPVDMQCYALKADELDCGGIETRQAFRNIMDEVRNRTGFDAKGNQIYVQVYPSREGGCEMFVTKLGLLCALGEGEERPSLSPAKNTSISPATKHQPQKQLERNHTSTHQIRHRIAERTDPHAFHRRSVRPAKIDQPLI